MCGYFALIGGVSRMGVPLPRRCTQCPTAVADERAATCFASRDRQQATGRSDQ